MATSKITRMDAQGRVLIPPHIRKELDLSAGQKVTVYLDGGTIKIRPTEELCVCCGRPAKGERIVLHEEKLICKSCAQSIAKALGL